METDSCEKVLYLIRHAKSSWDRPGMSDWERDLNERGRRDGPRMAAYCSEHFSSPTRILCSDSRRTRSTAEYLIESGWVLREAIKFTNDLYLASFSDIRDQLKLLPPTLNSVAVLAHNPGIHQSVLKFSNGGNVTKFPTFSIVRLIASCESWADAANVVWTVDSFIFPKKLFMD